MFGVNPYSPYGYAPQMGYQQPQGVQQQNFTQQQAQPQQQAPAVLYVPSVAHVKELDMRGLNKALVIVQNEPVIAMREANGMGLTSTEYYQLTKFDPEAVQAAPATDYVTRQEFDQFIATLTATAKPTRKNVKEDAE